MDKPIARLAPARPQRRRQRQRGFSLLESLISIVIFAFGLLGLVGLQAKATQYTASAEDSHRAALLANEIATEMWVRRTLALPEATLQAWSARVADPMGAGLPNGEGTVEVAGAVATVTISWRPPSQLSDLDHRYRTQVLLP
jgi:type IV pilus assembly protein PilV